MQKLSVFLSKTLFVITLVLGAFFFLRLFFIPLLPFFIALAFAAVSEPLVQRLRRKIGVKRGFAAFMIISTLLLTLGLGLGTLLFYLAAELVDWTTHLPELAENFPAVWNGALDRLSYWYSAAPPLIRTTLDSLARHLANRAPSLLGNAGEKLMGSLSALASKLPEIGLFLITTVLAIYFTGLSYPAILAFLKRQLPLGWQQRCRKLAQCCRSTLLKWFKAELLLIFVTFLILLAGFWWMDLEYALLLATAISLVDALPVLGTGIILFPWAAVSLLLGQTERAVALVMLYAAVLLTHSLLEPRLLAEQADLPPITALLAMYLGFHFMGVGGMVGFPAALLLVKQLSDAGVVRLWK